jgi:hypothetical protein
MNKRPGHVTVTSEAGYCSFCGRPRNLRREEHQLGTFVRTIVTCESCHRTLSSTMGVAGAEAPAAESAGDKASSDGAAVADGAPAAKPEPSRPASATRTRPESKPKATKARVTKTK